MFLNAVILILQETLEAALLLSIFLVLVSSNTNRALTNSWVAISLCTGLLGAWFYAASAPVISVWFDYVGMEVFDSLMQFIILLSLLLLCYGHYRAMNSSFALILMVLVIALGIVREVSEIILYVQGVWGQPESITPVFWGGLTGAGIGISSGIVLYYSLMIFCTRRAALIAMVLLAFFAGNMTSQAVLLLTQADWLPYTPQLWDSSGFITEYSVTGQLLYALIGYEANPSLLQVVMYIFSWCLIVLSPLFRKVWKSSNTSRNEAK